MASLVSPKSFPVHAATTETVNPLVSDSSPVDASGKELELAAIISSITAISQETRLRRNIAQATFCLPQNILGIACYALLQLTGAVVDVVEMNEVKIVVTSAPFGVSLGKVIILHSSLVSEYAVRHEYGHTMQGYKQGPFYLLFEGLISFVQAGFSLISPSFAAGYYDRWPENEANELGGVTRSGRHNP